MLGFLIVISFISANIAIASTGYSMGWTAPINSKLKANSTDNPLGAPASDDEIAWMGSLLNIGAMLGINLYTFKIKY